MFTKLAVCTILIPDVNNLVQLGFVVVLHMYSTVGRERDS